LSRVTKAIRRQHQADVASCARRRLLMLY